MMSDVVVHVLALDDVDDALLARYRSWLPDAELSARRERICARALVRWCLSERDPRLAPSEWVIERTDAGKPFVARADAPAFGVSHTDGLVACALATSSIGLDIMALGRAAEVHETVVRAFAPSEVAEVRALPAPAQARRALELWTAKEAYLKALGTGIARHLDRFTLAEAASNGWHVRVQEHAGRWLVATAHRGPDTPALRTALPA